MIGFYREKTILKNIEIKKLKKKGGGTLKNKHHLTAPQLPSLTIPHNPSPSINIPHHPSPSLVFWFSWVRSGHFILLLVILLDITTSRLANR